MHSLIIALYSQLQNIQNKYDEEVASAEQNFQVPFWAHYFLWMTCHLLFTGSVHYSVYVLIYHTQELIQVTKRKMVATIQEKIRRLHEEKIVAELTKGASFILVWCKDVYIVELVVFPFPVFPLHSKVFMRV